MHFKHRKLLAYVLCLTVLLSGMVFVEVRTTSAADPPMLTYQEGEVWKDTDDQTMTPEQASQWKYYVREDGTISLGYTATAGYIGDIVDGRIVGKVPAIINNKPVTRMEYTFHNNAQLKYAPEIPSSVTSMFETFNQCSALIEPPVIPNGVVDIRGAFSGCTALVSAPVIPDSVTDIGSAFYNCKALVSAPVIPDSVTSMISAFYGCESLVSVPDIPDSVTNMMYAFQKCISLIEVPRISNSVTNLYYTFEGCKSLVEAPVIPDSVTDIRGAFKRCESLIEAPVIPDGITDVAGLFEGCISLKSFPVLPDSVTGMMATFLNCASITGIIKIPAGITSTDKFSTNTFGGTTKPILLLYTSSQSSILSKVNYSNITTLLVPSNIGYNNSLPKNIMDTDTRVVVDIESLTGAYELSKGQELNFTATVSNPALQYKWVVQDLYDINSEFDYNASIDSTGKLNALRDGFVAVGLKVKFPDNTEHVYGAKVVKITNDGVQPVTAPFVSIKPGDTLASWNDSYSIAGSVGQYFSLPHDGIIVSENNPPSGDEQELYEPSTVTGNIVDKSVNYLKVGETTSYQVANLNPADAQYRFVARSMVQPASVSITDTGEVKAQSAGLSIILLVDNQNKVIDKLPVMVGENDVISPEEQEQLDNAPLDPDDYPYTAIGDGEYDVAILGNLEPITTLDVDVPISINFVIDCNRHFNAPVIKLVSHCAAPLKVSINNVSTVGDSPTLVDPATYTDDGWLSLGEADTRSKIGLILNGVGLYRKSGVIGTIPSAFNGEKDLDLVLTAKHGKSWGNMAGKNLQYNVELLIEMQ
jgi:hypothetical protein